MKKLLPIFLLIALIILLLPLADWVERGAGIDSARELPVEPQFSPGPGLYPRGTQVRMAPSQSRGQVIFSTDGSLPTTTVGTRYTHPLRFDADFPGVKVVRAVEVVGNRAGPVASASYAVGFRPGLPAVSLIAEPADLWDADRGLFTNPAWRGAGWERPIHATLFEPDGKVTFASNGGLRMHGSEPLNAPKQSLRLYFRQEYGESRVEAAVFPGHPNQPENGQTYKRFLLQAGETTPQWTLLRDQFVMEIANEMELPAAQGRFVWLFVNGTSWGIYRLTERVDRFFLEDNEGLLDVAVVQEGNAREGSNVDWKMLVDWAGKSNLGDPATFATFAEQVELDNFTEFAILQQYFEFPADALYAVRPPNGRWFWVYSGDGNDKRGGDFALLLEAALKNPEYRAYFQARLAGALNTVLAPEAIKAQGQQWMATLAPEYNHERARWAGVAPLDAEYAALMARLDARPAQLWERFAPQGMATVQLGVEPQDGGQLYLNGTRLPGAVWSGQYPVGATLEAVAVPSTGQTFSQWTGDTSSVATSVSLTVTGDATLTAQFLPISSEAQAVFINEVWLNDNGTRYAGVAYRPIAGDWVELLVGCPGPADLRGWRLTDNETKTGEEEGSLIFPQIEALAAVPGGTVVLILATENVSNTANFPTDDLDARDGRLLFYVGNGTLDTTRDPGFGLGLRGESLALLAPGPTDDFGDDVGVDFVAEGNAVTPYSFGVLRDGVTWDAPFRALGSDDGVFRSKDGWRVDPPACLSGDALCPDATNQVTPGALNPGQAGYRWQCWLGIGF
ncbi:MAG: CotH kinase family protein [Anaerolineae bacterium]|nr:CotH kinase family protein [Anaerolineae bacterium]